MKTWSLMALLFLEFCSSAFAGSTTTEHSPGITAPDSLKAHYSEENISRLLKYYRDTYRSLEAMRSDDTGLLVEKIKFDRTSEGTCSPHVLKKDTSPTNIALDLANLTDRESRPDLQKDAREKLRKELETLDRLPKKNGLFFAWYNADGKEPSPDTIEKNRLYALRHISSVDNSHLKLALYGIMKSVRDEKIVSLATKLYNQMDMSPFYDPETGLLFGLNEYLGKNPTTLEDNYRMQPWQYAHLGAEIRTAYAVGLALNWYGEKAKFSEALDKLFKNARIDDVAWKDKQKIRYLFPTWDGGAFQNELPDLFFQETKGLSKGLEARQKNYPEFIVKYGEEKGYGMPAGFSASNQGVDGETTRDGAPVYNGQSGVKLLTVSPDKADPKKEKFWEWAVTPHAILIHLPHDSDSGVLLEACRKMENIKSPDDGLALYQPGYGFNDAVIVRGPQKGKVIGVQLSLDQGMALAALGMLLNRDGLSAGGRALREDPAVYQKLLMFYKKFDDKLAKAPLLGAPLELTEGLANTRTR